MQTGTVVGFTKAFIQRREIKNEKNVEAASYIIKKYLV